MSFTSTLTRYEQWTFLICISLMSACAAQQADLKQTEKVLQQQLSQTRARQSQEISTLREYELPQLRGELEKALHTSQELQVKQDELALRLEQLEKQNKMERTRLLQRVDVLDSSLGKILLRIEEMEKHLQDSGKR